MSPPRATAHFGVDEPRGSGTRTVTGQNGVKAPTAAVERGARLPHLPLSVATSETRLQYQLCGMVPAPGSAQPKMKDGGPRMAHTRTNAYLHGGRAPAPGTVAGVHQHPEAPPGACLRPQSRPAHSGSDGGRHAPEPPRPWPGPFQPSKPVRGRYGRLASPAAAVVRSRPPDPSPIDATESSHRRFCRWWYQEGLWSRPAKFGRLRSSFRGGSSDATTRHKVD